MFPHQNCRCLWMFIHQDVYIIQYVCIYVYIYIFHILNLYIYIYIMLYVYICIPYVNMSYSMLEYGLFSARLLHWLPLAVWMFPSVRQKCLLISIFDPTTWQLLGSSACQKRDLFQRQLLSGSENGVYPQAGLFLFYILVIIIIYVYVIYIYILYIYNIW